MWRVQNFRQVGVLACCKFCFISTGQIKGQINCSMFNEVSWFVWVLVRFGWFFVLFGGKSPLALKRMLQLWVIDGLSRQETIEQHFPVNHSKIGHSYMKHLHTCLGTISFLFFFSPANKNSSCRSFDTGTITGKFRLILSCNLVTHGRNFGSTYVAK